MKITWSWIRDLETEQEMDELAVCHQLLSHVIKNDEPDPWSWAGSKDAVFSVKELKHHVFMPLPVPKSLLPDRRQQQPPSRCRPPPSVNPPPPQATTGSYSSTATTDHRTRLLRRSWLSNETPTTARDYRTLLHRRS
ncbi:hypothetical protein E3N88_16994 [Mikania micrantha]|uniref:Uncharacterized protein n=1 Tax=Mikania micrantha TaxID=192012 RepID=A0A5N6NTB8_9ASTR|nr:hypothetical protein E3N88_16994 [Mikania micrantha]